MPAINKRLESVNQQIQQALQNHHRTNDSVKLLAVSKTRPIEDISQAYAAGQHYFGESYIQEALTKIAQLKELNIEWHFIGRIQGNKTRSIAENFDWVHSIDNPKQIRRLNDQRPSHLAPLNICLQIKIDDEESKAGFAPDQVKAIIDKMADYPRLSLRGFMTLPAPAEGLVAQRTPFRKLRLLRNQLATPEIPLETLSMGMSDDLEAAIAEGSTIVRIGTAIFGPRNYPT
ncbi:MAG: YggS family pyridoxal phosphate-dependent enzyme [Sedimenticola sp.]|uniref:Pyridoxal phosphate homeostasis protein n=1 Tax=Sedimenticola thiotaurini TaxID=1543721 RepID=A0A558DC61_9GAMM|nr:YggS family pyridoxal phosphate-dependent enzyme [Sedimenticola sp.]MCW8946815.1 YggS family pyridoxal phosphate-dependent enzyme [Sedimenticola sp.]MCW9021915.1 YggS family pyridoxal phosphate-dependent enzyme [Sedimenticola sp.]TVT58600.1 MAG: YggS family pyridoxal phosphate-dependent enzyme [Sedimenticola thiotaurini]